jgi:hypothetical protein
LDSSDAVFELMVQIISERLCGSGQKCLKTVEKNEVFSVFFWNFRRNNEKY